MTLWTILVILILTNENTMKSWKDYPNLFCNGKFKAYPDQDRKESHLIVGLQPMFGGIYFTDNNNDGFPFLNCTLIARSIHDITDEEWMDMKGLPTFNKNQIKRRKKWFDVQVLIAEDLLYLLDIGVVPPQFWDDNTVMNINEVE